MAVPLQRSKTPPLPNHQEPLNTFDIALAELQFAQGVFVDAHSREVMCLRNEIVALRATCCSCKSFAMRECPSPQLPSLPPEFGGNQVRIDDCTVENYTYFEEPFVTPDPPTGAADDAGSCSAVLRSGTVDSVIATGPCKSDVRRIYNSMKSDADKVQAGLLSVVFGRCWSRPKSYESWQDQMSVRKLPYSCLEKLVHSNYFITAVGCFIVLNVIFILVDSDYAVRSALRVSDHQSAGESMGEISRQEWQTTADFLFMAIFSCELFLRIIAEEMRFAFGNNWKWNIFDSFLVGMSLLEYCVDGLGIDATFARLIRLFRMSRALKIIRVFKSFRELRVLLDSIFHIILPLLWSALTMAVVISMFSVVFLHATSAYVQNAPPHDSNVERLAIYFHSLPMCALSLFMALTGGESWWLILEPLLEISVVYAVVFVIFVIFMQLGVLNIVTSIFVENASTFTKLDTDMLELAAAEQHTYVMRQLKEIFDILDRDKSGAITLHEFECWTKDAKAKAFFERVLGLEALKVGRFFAMLDLDGDCRIEREEFVVGCMRLKGEAKNMDQEVLTHLAKTMKRDLKHIKHSVALMQKNMRSNP